MLKDGGKTNSLGRAGEVIAAVLDDKGKLEELFECLSDEDAWVRMRAADSLEKICRLHPDWLTPYIARLNEEVAGSAQPSLQWHLAQMYGEMALSDKQTDFAVDWIKRLLSSEKTDWIVAANAMDTLALFVDKGNISAAEAVFYFNIQLKHKSKAVVKRANKHIDKLTLG